MTAFHVFFDTLAGYAFAKKRFPGRNLLFWMIIATLMIPPQVTLVPLYLVIRQLGLVNNLLGVILPGFADVFGIFLMRQYIQTLPTRAGGGGAHRRLQRAGHLLADHPAAVEAGHRRAGDLHLRALLERLPLAADRAAKDARHYTLPVGVASLQNEFAVTTA